jgi:hypothetical protein
VQANNPWVVKLYTSFQDDLYLYLVMEVYSREREEGRGKREEGRRKKTEEEGSRKREAGSGKRFYYYLLIISYLLKHKHDSEWSRL